MSRTSDCGLRIRKAVHTTCLLSTLQRANQPEIDFEEMFVEYDAGGNEVKFWKEPGTTLPMCLETDAIV